MISCIYTFIVFCNPSVAFRVSVYIMAIPVIIEVETSDSDKENEEPGQEQVVTGHTASFEAIRSGEISRFCSPNLNLKRLCLDDHPTRTGVPGLSPMFGEFSL